MTRKVPSWTLATAVGSLALVGIAASATHYLREPCNPGFLDFPFVTALHVVLGGIYLILAPLQFVSRIRSRLLAYHRQMGEAARRHRFVVGAPPCSWGWSYPSSVGGRG